MTLPRDRGRLAELACKLIGPDVAKLVSNKQGWPAVIELITSDGLARVAMHVGPIGTFSRKAYESRFQNLDDSSLPVAAPGGATPILVGITADQSPLFVVVDGASRKGNSKRFSLLFNRRVLIEAGGAGWGEYVSTRGEHFLAIRPQLLPLAVEMLRKGLPLSGSHLPDALPTLGLLAEGALSLAQRGKRTTQLLIRDAKFRLMVRAAYNHCCAMCGLSLGLVEGAHILPVSVEGSTDDVWNGVALCRNHHRAFDSHLIHVDASTLAVRQHRKLLEKARTEPAARAFSNGTFATLKLPRAAVDRPRRSMFQARERHFNDQYRWVSS